MNNSDVETLYAQAVTLSQEEQHQFLLNLTVEMRMALRALHLRTYLSEHPDLNDLQKEIIDEAIAIRTSSASLYARPGSADWEDAKRAAEANRRRALEVFSDEQIVVLFYRIGPLPPDARGAPLPGPIS